MNVFQIIKAVLDEAYDEIPGNNAEKDTAILQELNLLTSKYLKLKTEENEIAYSQAVTRFSYIYKYVTSHANLVCTLIEKSNDIKNLFVNDKRVSVACIGGGPGSDFLGILKYIMKHGKLNPVKFHIYDRERAWEDSWFDVENKVDTRFHISTSYMPFDVTIPAQWESNKKYFQSDLFTMIYFMSEVFKLRDEADVYFKTLFSQAKSGSLFLFVDNNDKDFYEWFDEFANANDVEIIARDETRLVIPNDEKKSDLGVYFQKFSGHYPKLQARVAYRIGRKK